MEITRIVIIDVSGSMNHSFENRLASKITSRVSTQKNKFEAALEYLRFALEKMPPDSELIIIAFEGSASVVYKGGVQNKSEIEESISKLKADGGSTHLGSAFQLVLQLLDGEKLRIRPLEVITDGISSDNPTDLARVLQRQFGVFIHLYLIDPTDRGLSLAREIVGAEGDGEVDPISSSGALSLAQLDDLTEEQNTLQLMRNVLEKQAREFAVFRRETIEQERPKVKVAFPQYLRYGQWRSLDVFVYLERFNELVEREVEKHRVMNGSDYEGLTFNLPKSLPEGTPIQVVLRSETIRANPANITIAWFEPYNKLPFRIVPLNDAPIGNTTIDVEIYANNLIIGEIEIPIYITDEEIKPSLVTSNLRVYENIFASYAREDIDIVKHLKSRYAALGIYMFIDLEDLRAGALWRSELLGKIEKSDLFQLFWSQSARNSNNVEIEWEYALTLTPYKGIGFVRPIYWRIPMPSAPNELSMINFRYVDLSNS